MIIAKVGLDDLAPDDESAWESTARLPLLFVSYSLAVFIANSLWLPATNVATICLPSGFYLAILLLDPVRRWPVVMATLLLAQVTADMFSRRSIDAGLLFFIAETGGAAIGAMIIRRCGRRANFSDIHHLLIFVFGGVFANSLTSALIGSTIGMRLSHMPVSSATVFRIWSVGDALGALIVTPVVLAGHEQWRRGFEAFRRIHWFELLMLFAGAAVLAQWIFGYASLQRGMELALLPYVAIPIVMWAALRCGPAGAALTTFVFASVALWNSSRDVTPALVERHLMIQSFMGVLSLTGLTFAAVINERLAAELSLRESEAKLNQIAATMPGAVYQYHIDMEDQHRFLFISEGIETLYGVSAAEGMADAQAMWKQIHPEDVPHVARTVRQSFETFTPWFDEFRITTPTGENKWIRGNSVPRRLPGGSMMWNGILTDITASKNSEIELQQARDAAEAASRAKSAFLANISHELRTPLNAILGFADLLQRDFGSDLSPRQFFYVKNISEGGRYLLSLVENLLDIAKIEAGKESLSLQTVDLAALLRSLVELLRAQIDRQNLNVAVDIQAVGSIVADEQKIRQIVLNLLSNAIKFTSAGGRIGLEANRNGAEITLCVWDTGIGIAASDHDRIWGEFEQVEDSQTRRFRGAGLGLAVVRQLVELHGGHVWLDSQAGAGSRFYVSLPVAPSSYVETLPSGSDGNIASGSIPEVERLQAAATVARMMTEAPAQAAADPDIRVLVIDNEPVNNILVRDTLSDAGFMVRDAESGRDGLAAAQDDPPDAILLDMQLPDMNGMELLKQLRDSPRTASIPVIAFTAHAAAEDRGRYLEAGCVGYIGKPIDVNLFPSDLRAMIGNRTNQTAQTSIST